MSRIRQDRGNRTVLKTGLSLPCGSCEESWPCVTSSMLDPPSRRRFFPFPAPLLRQAPGPRRPDVTFMDIGRDQEDSAP